MLVFVDEEASDNYRFGPGRSRTDILTRETGALLMFAHPPPNNCRLALQLSTRRSNVSYLIYWAFRSRLGALTTRGRGHEKNQGNVTVLIPHSAGTSQKTQKSQAPLLAIPPKTPSEAVIRDKAISHCFTVPRDTWWFLARHRSLVCLEFSRIEGLTGACLDHQLRDWAQCSGLRSTRRNSWALFSKVLGGKRLVWEVQGHAFVGPQPRP